MFVLHKRLNHNVNEEVAIIFSLSEKLHSRCECLEEAGGEVAMSSRHGQDAALRADARRLSSEKPR